MEISQDGKAVVNFGNHASDPREKVIQLSDTETDALRDVLEANPIEDFPEFDPDAICADCFEYSLTYGGESYTYESGAPESEARSAVTQAIFELGLPEDSPTGLG